MKKLLSLIVLVSYLALFLPTKAAIRSTDGASAQYVDCGSAAVLDNITNQTFAAWVKLTTLDPAGTRIIMAKGGGGVGNNFAMLSTGTGTLQLFRETGTTDDDVSALWSSFTGAAANTWMFVAGTRTGTSTHALYVGTRSLLAAPPSTYSVNTGGSGPLGNDGANTIKFSGGVSTQGLPGDIAWVGVWNRALTQRELWQVQTRNYPTNGIVLSIQSGFNGLGTPLDRSGYRHSCSFVGSGSTVAPHSPTLPI